VFGIRPAKRRKPLRLQRRASSPARSAKRTSSRSEEYGSFDVLVNKFRAGCAEGLVSTAPLVEPQALNISSFVFFFVDSFVLFCCSDWIGCRVAKRTWIYIYIYIQGY
jgi:hypothetical protein